MVQLNMLNVKVTQILIKNQRLWAIMFHFYVVFKFLNR